MLVRRARCLCAMLVAAAAVVGCSGGAPDVPGGSGTPASTGGSFTVAIGKPATLIPGAAASPAERQVVHALFTGLVRYGSERGQPLLAVASSIRSPDQKHWTITIESGWTFHNGEPVTAENFVRAWSATAYGPRGWAGNRLMSRIAGYDKLNSGRPQQPAKQGSQQPQERRLSGLRVIDKRTFSVTLDKPFSAFPAMLGKAAFFPLPRVAFENFDAYARQPVGNGQYQMVQQWQGGGSIELRRYDDYTSRHGRSAAPGDPIVRNDKGPAYRGGRFEANIDRLTFKTYASKDRAYRDLVDGKVDIVPSLPPRRYGQAQREFGNRFVFRPGDTLMYLGLPLDGRFADARARRAISMAIDRERLVETYFSGVPTPADSLVFPLLFTGQQSPCTTWCEYHPDTARKLLAATGGDIKSLQLSFPAGHGYRPWMRTIGDMLEHNLGIDKVTLRPRKSQPAPGRKAATGPWLGTWSMTYPSAQSYLEPLFTQGGRANRTGYASDRVDQLVQRGNRADSIAASMDHYHHAETIVLGDMPVVPLWFNNANAAYSPQVDNVIVNDFGIVEVARVRQS